MTEETSIEISFPYAIYVAPSNQLHVASKPFASANAADAFVALNAPKREGWLKS